MILFPSRQNNDLLPFAYFLKNDVLRGYLIVLFLIFTSSFLQAAETAVGEVAASAPSTVGRISIPHGPDLSQANNDQLFKVGREGNQFAIEFLTSRAERGQYIAALYLSYLYNEGWGVRPNRVTALKYASKAKEGLIRDYNRGYPTALQTLETLYSELNPFILAPKLAWWGISAANRRKIENSIAKLPLLERERIINYTLPFIKWDMDVNHRLALLHLIARLEAENHRNIFELPLKGPLYCNGGVMLAF